MLLAVLVSVPARAAAQSAAGATPVRAVRVFLDCNRCDESYLKREVMFIDYVRNREDADVHVLVSTQQTGSGGTQFLLKFIGLGRFEGVDQSLTYSAPETATSDEVRQGFAHVFKLGLVRYAAESTLAQRLRITFSKPPGGAQPTSTVDRWNYWVFRASGGGNFSGEATTASKSINASLRASRTTAAWRHVFNASVRYRESRFDLEDGEVVRTIRRDSGFDAIVVKTLSDHWSAGLLGTAESSSFRNYDLRARVAPGLEYNLFPYSESSRRMITMQYTVGIDSNDYHAPTVYGKTSERLIDHRLEFGLGLRQPWGTASAEVNYSQFLTAPSKYSIGAHGSLNVRLFRGFSFNVFGDVSRPRDQIYLAAEEASTEEILLRQRQLATDYSYFIGFGLSYSFGSIFNNIVNPRFGGAGGF